MYLVHFSSTFVHRLCLLPISFDAHREERRITVFVGFFHELVSIRSVHLAGLKDRRAIRPS